MTDQHVRVDLGPDSYDIVLGSGTLDRLGELLAAHCPAHSYAIITDTAVAPLYAERVKTAATDVAPAHVYTFAAGEWNKTRDTWQALTDQLLANRHGRDAAVIALGGGVVGDMAGFVAATFRRGVPYVQLPTSLLAMIDSSIGGKTGVDTGLGKNLVGAFHQPQVVVADIQTLTTLPPVQLAAGMAEALKHGAIADESYFSSLVDRREAIRSLDQGTLLEAVKRSVEIKAQVVADDEREHGRRAILNFGHTIGHALEATLGYELLHGEAVAIGMLAESTLGVLEGVSDPATVSRLDEALASFRLPTTVEADISLSDLLEVLAQDKKSRRGTVKFALLERIGSVAGNSEAGWTRTVSDQHVSTVLRDLVAD